MLVVLVERLYLAAYGQTYEVNSSGVGAFYTVVLLLQYYELLPQLVPSQYIACIAASEPSRSLSLTWDAL